MAWAPDYLSLAEQKDFLRVGDSDDDAQVGVAVTASSRAVDRCCNRQFGVVAAAEQRFYTAHWDRARGRWVVEVDDLMSTTGLVAEVQDSGGATVGVIDAYTLEPRNAAPKSRPWTRLVVSPASAGQPTGATGEVAVVAPWGWTAVPVTVKQATHLQASRFLARRDSPFGIAGSPDMGSELRLLSKVDADVAVALADYKRWWSAA